MTPRESRLAIAVVVALVLWFGNRGLGRYREAVQNNSDAHLQAIDSLTDARVQAMQARRARRQLQTWRRQSLPANRNVARSLYQDWLREELSQAGVTVKDVSDNSNIRSSGTIAEVSFGVSAEATIESLASFLNQFYDARFLHRISGSTVTRVGDGDKLSVDLSIDALIIPGSSRVDKLPESADTPPQPLPDSLQSAIVKRHLFAAYAPPKEKPAEAAAEQAAAGNNEEAKNARLTGLTYGGGGWRLTISRKDQPRPEYYIEGDPFQFGSMQGHITRLDGDQRRVIIETEKGRMEIRLGQTFADAQLLDKDAS